MPTIMIRSAGAKFPPEYSDRNLLLLYLSLSLSPILSSQVRLLSHIPLDTWQSQNVWLEKAVMTVSLALWVLELPNFSAWSQPLRLEKMGPPVSVVKHLIRGTENMWRFLAVIRSGCFLVSSDEYLILRKIVQILDMRYLVNMVNFRQYTACICNTHYM